MSVLRKEGRRKMKKKILSFVFTVAVFLSVLFAALWTPNSSPAKETGTITYVRVCDVIGCYIQVYEDGILVAEYPE